MSIGFLLDCYDEDERERKKKKKKVAIKEAKMSKEALKRHRFVEQAIGDNCEAILNRLRKHASVGICAGFNGYDVEISGETTCFEGSGKTFRSALMRAVRAWANFEK